MLTEAVEGLCEPRVSGLQSLEAAEAVIKCDAHQIKIKMWKSITVLEFPPSLYD